MFQWLKKPVVYARVSRNRFHLRHAQKQKDITVNAIEAFTNKRLLIAEFTIAENLLSSGLKQLLGGGLLSFSPVLVMHPLEMTEGGLSSVEERVLKELAFGAGARGVIIWTGHGLTDDEVLTRAGQGE